jgi:large repetitive protein
VTLGAGPNNTTAILTVSGMTQSGTVTASVAANAFTDAAGNGNTASTSTDNTVTYSTTDTTPPSATPSLTDTSGNPISPSAGWYGKQVKVTWNWRDNANGSGLDAAHCTTSTTSATQGELTLSATCKDIAGNQGSASQVVKVDTVAPSITYAGAAPASPNAQGWYKTNVTLSFTGTDATSGIAACPNRTMGEGLAKTATGTCTDNAGNRKTLLSPTFNIDKTKPIVNVLMNGGAVLPNTTPTYSLAHGVPTASCNTLDVLSGVAVSASPSVVNATTGQAVSNPPTVPGSYRAKCAGALDRADNANERTIPFRVIR